MSHFATATPPPTGPSSDFGAACDALAGLLAGDGRRRIVTAAYRERDFPLALARLRTALRTQAFRTGSEVVDLGAVVHALDAATRRDGFHVFLEWHEVAYRFLEEEIPLVLLDYVASLGEVTPPPEQTLAILLDFHLLYVLALCSTRVWDEPDPGAGLDRLGRLLVELRGPGGSDRRFVDDAETLLWLAISTYEPDDLAYRRLLERVRALPVPRRVRIARVGAPLLGCHLRWGFPHLYEGDLGRMRADNYIDYPWLFFSLAALIGEYDRLVSAGAPDADRLAVAACLLNGLSPDPEAVLGEPPPSLEPQREEHARVRALFARRRAALAADFARLRPVEGAWSPLGMHFNFPHNAVFALAVLALGGEQTPNLSLDALLADRPDQGKRAEAAVLARELTAFAAANPEPRGSRSVLGLYYDADAARSTWEGTRAALDRLVPAR